MTLNESELPCAGSSLGLMRLRGGGKLEYINKIFVSNLPKTIDDKGLENAFEEFGKIKSAKVRFPSPAPQISSPPKRNFLPPSLVVLANGR